MPHIKTVTLIEVQDGKLTSVVSCECDMLTAVSTLLAAYRQNIGAVAGGDKLTLTDKCTGLQRVVTWDGLEQLKTELQIH